MLHVVAREWHINFKTSQAHWLAVSATQGAGNAFLLQLSVFITQFDCQVQPCTLLQVLLSGIGQHTDGLNADIETVPTGPVPGRVVVEVAVRGVEVDDGTNVPNRVVVPMGVAEVAVRGVEVDDGKDVPDRVVVPTEVIDVAVRGVEVDDCGGFEVDPVIPWHCWSACNNMVELHPISRLAGQ